MKGERQERIAALKTKAQHCDNKILRREAEYSIILNAVECDLHNDDMLHLSLSEHASNVMVENNIKLDKIDDSISTIEKRKAAFMERATRLKD